MAIEGTRPGTHFERKRVEVVTGENKRESVRQREIRQVDEAMRKGYINQNVRDFFKK